MREEFRELREQNKRLIIIGIMLGIFSLVLSYLVIYIDYQKIQEHNELIKCQNKAI